MAAAGSSAISLPAPASAAPEKRMPGAVRFRFQEENLSGLCWLVAISGTMLAIGIAGAVSFEAPFSVTTMGRAGLGAADNDATDMTMAELAAMEEAPEMDSTEEEVVEETLEVPVEPIEIPLEALDLPEPIDVLVAEDVFTVPAAPPIEVALKPIDPEKPKPKAAPRPAPVKAASTPKASGKPPGKKGGGTATAAKGGSGSGGGEGGNGRIGAGGKGRFPKPAYPSAARSRKVSGTLMVRLRISASGSVTSAVVISSNCTNGGFTSGEQSQITSFICRTWRFPAGVTGSRNLPLRFNLSSR